MSQKGNAMELGTQPVGKLLMQYAIPAIIAMTASSLYNIVDSIFIGQAMLKKSKNMYIPAAFTGQRQKTL